MKPERGYAALRRHRYSTPGSNYFVTCCTQDRRKGLNAPAIAQSVVAEITACETASHSRLRGLVIMPDHMHLLLQLGTTLTLGQLIGRLKAKTCRILATASLRWQGNYYEHHLRPDDSLEQILHYLYLNPYRAGLLAVNTTYPWFLLGAEESAWFRPRSDDGRPFPEWLD